jgi:hypothetical protein
MNWKGFGRKSNCGVSPALAWRYYGKSQNPSIRIICASAEFLTEHLQYTDLKRNRWTDLVGGTVHKPRDII